MSTTANSRDLTVYLLSTMRATTLVASAFRQLCVDDQQISQSRSRVIASQFESIGHPMKLYEQVLGRPRSTENAVASDSNRALAARYRLEPWPDLDFVVFGTIDELATSWRFERPPRSDSVELGDVTRWTPWRTVEGDLEAAWAGEAKVTDEWYPQRDILLSDEHRGEQAVAQFDYGLLQRVERLGAPHRLHGP